MSDITPRARQKALEAEKVLDELLGSIPDREPFREARARLIEAEALISAIAEGVDRLETFKELEDIGIHDEATAELEAGATPRTLEEVAAEVEREVGRESADPEGNVPPERAAEIPTTGCSTS